ncbi:MAG: DUF1684 domain-containing protein [Candidatus Kariarchaeaceae archaeon]
MTNKDKYIQDIKNYRERVDKWMKTHPDSPLTEEDKLTFSKQDYFSIKPNYKFETEITVNDKEEIIEIATNTGEIQSYYVYGYIQFEIENQTCELTVFKKMKDSNYFIPFWDTTCKNESYGAGRYLFPTDLGNNKIFIDFNIANNMSCAYSDRFTCTLVPQSNHLKLAIKAGMMKYK